VIPGESEKQFQKEVVRFARTLRIPVFFTQRSLGSPAGWPDLVLLTPPELRLRELKTDAGKLTPIQAETIEQLKRCTSLSTDVWRPADWHRIVEELLAWQKSIRPESR